MLLIASTKMMINDNVFCTLTEKKNGTKQGPAEQ
jgi:hypothetical protein